MQPTPEKLFDQERESIGSAIAPKPSHECPACIASSSAMSLCSGSTSPSQATRSAWAWAAVRMSAPIFRFSSLTARQLSVPFGGLREKLLCQRLRPRSLLVGDHSRQPHVRRGVEQCLDLGGIKVFSDALVSSEEFVE